MGLSKHKTRPLSVFLKLVEPRYAFEILVQMDNLSLSHMKNMSSKFMRLNIHVYVSYIEPLGPIRVNHFKVHQ